MSIAETPLDDPNCMGGKYDGTQDAFEENYPTHHR
jgi:hypothetical protein